VVEQAHGEEQQRKQHRRRAGNSTFDKNRFIDSSAVFIAVSGVDASKETGVPTREK
jgi:hypothetical protein